MYQRVGGQGQIIVQVAAGDDACDARRVAADDGGGIWNRGMLTVIDSTISGNTADYGGGIYNLLNHRTNVTMLAVTNSIISGNSATLFGGDYHGYTDYTPLSVC